MIQILTAGLLQYAGRDARRIKFSHIHGNIQTHVPIKNFPPMIASSSFEQISRRVYAHVETVHMLIGPKSIYLYRSI